MTTIPQDEEKMDENDKQTLKKADECQEHGESIVATIKDPKNYQPFIESLTNSLLKRESVLGRYNDITAQSYAALGDIYLQMGEPRAVVMYRTCFRIHTFLYGKCNGHISGSFRDVLGKQRGLSQSEIEEVRADVLASMKFEMEGDLLRRYGDRKAAAREYQKAARVEEFAFGRDNPDLAFVCRKMACLASIKKGVTLYHVLDFEEADRIGHRWIRNAKDALFPSVCAHIRKGDKYYDSLLYGHAVSEYLRATMLENNLDRKSKSGKSKHKSSKSSKREKETEDMAEELRLLVAGKLPPKASLTTPTADATAADEEQTHVSQREKPTAIKNGGTLSENGMHSKGAGNSTQRQQQFEDESRKSPRIRRYAGETTDFSTSKQSPREYQKRPVDEIKMEASRQNQETESHRMDRRYSGKSSKGKVSEAIRRFEDSDKPTKPPVVAMEVSTKSASVRPATPTKARASIPNPPKSSPAPSIKSTRSSTSSKRHRKRAHQQQTTSGALHTGKAKESLSESSLATYMKAPSYLEPKKPKSDSYITKIAHKTTKLAKNHLKSQLQRSRSSSSKDKSARSGGGGASSFFASLRKDRTTPSSQNQQHEEPKQGKEQPVPNKRNNRLTEEAGGSSSTYLLLASPPMSTHFYQQDSDKELENFLKEDLAGESLSSFQLPSGGTPMVASPSGRGSDPRAHSSLFDDDQQDESIAESNVFGHSVDSNVSAPIKQPQQYRQFSAPRPAHQNKKKGEDNHNAGRHDDDDGDAGSTGPLKLPNEYASVLDNFLDEQKPSSKLLSLATSNNTMDTQSVVTSDESIRERFLTETAQMTDTILKEDKQAPSLVELVAHVQKMSAILQRQTFRLQHKLGDHVLVAPSNSKKQEQKKELPKGTIELCREVERLFEDCDDTLEEAFTRLDDNAAKEQQKRLSSSSKAAGGVGMSASSDGAMEEYRKTFALEQVFLNDLRKSVADLLSQYKTMDASSRSGSSAEEEEEVYYGDEDEESSFAEETSSYDDQKKNKPSSSSTVDSILFDLPGFQTTVHPENSSGSILEESMLSVVFEDTSNSKSPSDQPTRLRLD